MVPLKRYGLLRSSSAWRAAYMGLVGLIATGLGACDRHPDAPGQRNNAGIRHIILISLDTTRADHLGCYGHAGYQTPAIDAVAAESLLFENFVCAAPSTLASHTSMLTGCYPHTHGTPRNGFYVNDENQLLAEVLSANGFTTAAFIGSFALSSIYNLSQGFEYYDERLDYSVRKSASHERLAADVTDAVLNWLAAHRPRRMFLFVHYFDAHSSYTPPPPYDRKYRTDTLPIRGNQKDISEVRRKLKETNNRAVPEVGVLDALYSGEISYLDEHLGRLFEGFRKAGIWNQSLVIITGDHGETFAEHREHFDHGKEVYDTTITPPLIVRFPNGAGGGRRVSGVVSGIDLMPTILDWLEIKRPDRMEGTSFAGLRDAGNIVERGPVFCEATKPFYKHYENHPVWRNQKKMKCIRTQRWKLVWRPIENKYEFYDLRTDPVEQINLLAAPGFNRQTLVVEMKRALHTWADRANPLPSEKVSSSKSIRMMKQMGYAQ